MATKPEIKTYHRYLDEAGDTTFYAKGKVPIVGQTGISNAFILGMVKIKRPLDEVRQKIEELKARVLNDPYFKAIPSLNKKVGAGGYYFHATDDIPEVRKLFFDYIFMLDCSFEAIVARKIPELFERKHNGKESEFYADLLSHLLKNKLGKKDKLVLNIAERGKSTKNINLEFALNKAVKRFEDNPSKNGKIATANVVFNVQNHRTEPLLNIADYFCWSVQRVFEKGETRYYDFLSDKISLIVDLYDADNYKDWGNYYSPKKKLTAQNKISPL